MMTFVQRMEKLQLKGIVVVDVSVSVAVGVGVVLNPR